MYKQIGLASLIMMTSVFLSRVIGLFREMALAAVGGAGSAVDAYQIAFVLPEILNHILASGFLSVTFIPIFTRHLAAYRETDAWQAFSVIISCFGLIMLILICLMFVLARPLVALIAPGLNDPLVLDQAVSMTRIIIPAQFFFFVGGMFMAVQFARQHFFIPALAPLIYNIGIIMGGLLAGTRYGVEGFAWGALFGAGIGNFFLQWIGARRQGMRFSLMFRFNHPDLKKYILVTLPLMLGLTMVFSTEFFIRFFGSYVPAGGISALNYALRTMLLLAAFFGQAIGVASFPFMANLAAKGDFFAMNELLNKTLKYLSLIIPGSILFMVLRHEIIRILFERGKFDAAATGLTAGVLLFLMIGAYPFAAQTIVSRAYYAMQDTLFPSLYSTISVMLSLPIFFIGVKMMGVQGVGAAVSISAMLQVFLLYAVWNRRSKNQGSAAVYSFLFKITAISLPLGLALEMFRCFMMNIIGSESLAASLLVSGIIGVLFLMLFLPAATVMLNRRELEEIRHLIRRKSKKV